MLRQLPKGRKMPFTKPRSSLGRWIQSPSWGEHTLLLYETTGDLLKVALPYLQAGLTQNQACLWVVSAMPLEEAKKALRSRMGGLSPYTRKKQLTMVTHLDWYLSGGSFDEKKVAGAWLKKEEEALRRGFAGLRIAGDIAWAEKNLWPRLLHYEARVSRGLAGRKIVALCAYPADGFPAAKVANIANVHDLIIAKEGRTLRLTRPVSAGGDELCQVKLPEKPKQAKEKINSYEFMFESARDAIFYKDLQSRYIMVNNKTLEAFGLPREEVIGKNDLEIMADKKEAEKNIADDQFVFKTGKSTEITKHMTGADGKEYWFEAIKVPQFDDKGNVIGLVGIARDITERKLTEAQLKESEEKCLILYETITDGIAGGPMDGRIAECNQAFADMLGYSKEELKNLTYQEITPTRWHQMDAKIVEEQILKRGYSDEYEKEYIRKDGTVFPISAKVWLARDEDGKPQGMWGIVRDITERKKAEEALSQSEEKYRTLSQNIPGMVFRGRPDWSTEIISNSEPISGYSAEDFNSGKLNWLDIIHPDDKERVLKEALTLEEKPQSVVQEYRIITKDGSIRWVEEHKTSLFKGGVFQGVDGIAFDFTKRRRAEQALRLVEVKYQALFESSPEGILIADLRNQEFKYANPAMCKLLGYSQEEFRTMAKKDINPKESMEYVLPESYPQARGEKPPAQNIPLVRKDGKTIFVDINTANALIDDKECVIAFFRDVTGRKRGRESFKKKSDEMLLLNEVATCISEAQNLKEAADRTLEALCKGLKVPMARLYVLDQNQEVLRLLTLYGASKRVSQAAREIELGRHPVGRAAEKKALEVWAFSRPVTIKKTKSGQALRARFAAALPLTSGKNVLGVIYFWGWDKRMFTSDELRLFKTIGAQVGTAIENTRLFEEAGTERDRSQALHEVGMAIANTLDLKEVARRSLEAVLKVVKQKLGSIYVFDEEQSMLRIITYVGFPEEGARKHKEIKAGTHHFVWRAAAQKKITMPDSSPKTPRRKRSKSIPKATCSGRPIAVPLISKGKVRGVMKISTPHKEDYTLEELDFLKAVSSQVATAIENAQLFEKARTERDRSEALVQISHTISNTLDLKEVARRSLEAVLRATHLDGGSIYIFNENHSALRVITHLGAGERAARNYREIKAGSHHFVWRAAAEKKVLLSSPPSESRLVKQQKSLPKSTCGRVVALPLVSKGKVRGVMVVGSPDRENYTPDELDFLKAVSSQVATAIENAQLYQEAQENVAKLRALSSRLTRLQEEERSRIANYLHSNLAQTLTTAKMNLDLLCQQTDKNPPKPCLPAGRLRKSLSKVILMLEEAIKETRDLMLDLRNPVLDDLGLIPAVRSYAKDFFQRTGVKVKINTSHCLEDLSKNRRTMLFSIIQELLCNVAKHAKVSRANLTLGRCDGMDVVVVRDTGGGFKPDALRPSGAATTGLGLVAIREMVSHSEGHLAIDSAPGRGTTVTVQVPMENYSLKVK